MPRIISLRSPGMPSHKGLLPSTISRHSSLASLSEQFEGRRYASKVLIRESVEGGDDGISRIKRERISPITIMNDAHSG